MGVLGSGFRLPWKAEKAPLSSSKIAFPSPQSPDAVQALDLEVRSLLEKGATEEVLSETPGFYGRIFVVPKSSGGWRPVLDLSTLNLFLENISFRMESPSSIRDSIHRGDWATSIDLKDAYFHILIHKSDRKFLRFVWKGRIFQFVALPFGLAPAPWVFTKIVREFCGSVRAMGFRLKVYLDDWLILASSKALCSKHMDKILSMCQELGFQINWKKSELVPKQRFLYLGMTFDTVSWRVSPSIQRIDKLHALLGRLRNSNSATAREWAALLGIMESMAPLLQLGRLHKRAVQRLFRSRWSQDSQSWGSQVQLGPLFERAIAQWLCHSWLSSGVPITPPPPQEQMFTDASSQGWGAHVGALTASGQWGPQMAKAHINLQELEAVRLAAIEFEDFLRDKHTVVNTDNTTVACYLNKQGGARSDSLSTKAEDLLLWCQSHSIRISAKYVPGKLNILADALSRSHMVLSTEWTLVHNTLLPIWETWHKPQLDLFATKFNKRLPLYASPVPDPEAWAIDALSIPWEGLDAYAFPPFPILGKVLRKAREEGPRLILVAPRWPAQSWFPELLALSHVPPLELVVKPSSLVQPRSGVPHANPSVLQLHAWLLCGTLCQHEAPPTQ